MLTARNPDFAAPSRCAPHDQALIDRRPESTNEPAWCQRGTAVVTVAPEAAPRIRKLDGDSDQVTAIIRFVLLISRAAVDSLMVCLSRSFSADWMKVCILIALNLG